MPREVNEKTVSLYFINQEGKNVKMNAPEPKEGLTSEEVREQMDAILAIGDLFDLVSVKGAGTTHRTVTAFNVQA